MITYLHHLRLRHWHVYRQLRWGCISDLRWWREKGTTYGDSKVANKGNRKVNNRCSHLKRRGNLWKIPSVFLLTRANTSEWCSTFAGWRRVKEKCKILSNRWGSSLCKKGSWRGLSTVGLGFYYRTNSNRLKVVMDDNTHFRLAKQKIDETHKLFHNLSFSVVTWAKAI